MKTKIVVSILFLLVALYSCNREKSSSPEAYDELIRKAYLLQDETQITEILNEIEENYLNNEDFPNVALDLAFLYYHYNDYVSAKALLNNVDESIQDFYLGTFLIQTGEVEQGNAILEAIYLEYRNAIEDGQQNSVDPVAIAMLEKILSKEDSLLPEINEISSMDNFEILQIEMIKDLSRQEVLDSIWQ